MMCLIYFNISLMFFLNFLWLMFYFLKFLFLKMKLYIEISLLHFMSMNFSLILYFDYKSFLFMGVVMLISSMIIIYSFEYMYYDINKMYFIYILFLFVISMLMMILGQNLLMILLGWDGLGLISYLLVIYYNNWSAYNSGMLTLLTNRLGDIGLLISIGLFSMMGDWNYLFLYKMDNLMIFFMIFLASFTKSAQIPFSSWLPKAMAAPTPISALVHSSTLVTAGVYLMIRFNKILLSLENFKILLLFLSLMTMFFSGLIASFENDLKKIIALSTLSQLGLMMMSVLSSLNLLGFFHLIIHAMFKSLLFMCAGLILHSMMNNQDIRLMGVLSKNYFLTLMMFNCANMALCGFPFMSGFFSKDLILELMIFSNLSFFILIMFYISIMFTVIYTFRLVYFSMKNFMKFFSYFNLIDSSIMNFSMFIMFFLSIFSGSILNLILFNSLNLIYFYKELKIITLILIFFSIFIGLSLNELNNKKLLWLKLKKYFYFMNSMWLLNLMSNLMIKNNLLLSGNLFIYIEKGWGEVLGKLFFFMMFKKFLLVEKLSMLIIIQVLLMFMLFFFILIF